MAEASFSSFDVAGMLHERGVDGEDHHDLAAELFLDAGGHSHCPATGGPDGGHASRWPAFRSRSEAYYSALRDAGIAADPGLVVNVDWGGLQGAHAMGELLGLREPPTAVYAHSNEIALGAMRTLRRAGLRVPEDISVIGIDNHPLAGLTDLTTVSQPVYEQGQLAGQMVLALLQGEDVEQALTVPTTLVIRRSTAPPRITGTTSPST